MAPTITSQSEVAFYRDQPGVPTDRPDLATVGQPAGGNATLVQEPDNLRSRWQEVQIGFVDGPRKAVQAADELVQEVLHEVQQRLADERSGLEAQWSRGEDVSTEELRQALLQYRVFFNRLLNT